MRCSPIKTHFDLQIYCIRQCTAAILSFAYAAPQRSNDLAKTLPVVAAHSAARLWPLHIDIQVLS